LRRAVISLGTNTTRLLVVEERPDGSVAQIEARQVGTRLGEGLRDGGALSADGARRTLAAARGVAERARELGAELCSIATSAMRRADDAPAFAARMSVLTGVELLILAGSVEAEASFRGATYGRGAPGRIAVIDVGGGSTECAVGTDGRLEGGASVEIGSVRIAERFPATMGRAPRAEARAAAAAARIDVAARLAPFGAFVPVTQARCVAGTPLTLAAVATASHVERMSGFELTLAELDATLERLVDLDLEERRALPGMLAQRADIIVAGGLILAEALRLLGLDRGIVEENDLLLGFLLMERERPSGE
jgi:exopolyphosphatase/guanosine-5'-triphosphate,3'-diphosphate pyrophosphatase